MNSPADSSAKLAIICGSQRLGSQSAKVGRYIRELLTNELGAIESYLLDLAENPLPFWDDSEPLSGIWQGAWGGISEQLQASEAFIFVTPEWGGMVPAALKNFFLLCNDQELSHKPGLIVSVARRQSGSYPVAELRMSSYKNNQICYIPEHIIVREVEQMFNSPRPASDQEAQVRDRLVYAIRLLLEYAKALRGVRASGVFDPVRYPWGM